MLRLSRASPYAILAILLLAALWIPLVHSKPPLKLPDTAPPIILAINQSNMAINVSDSILLSAQAIDYYALSWAYLITNETGIWQRNSPWWDSHWTRSIKITVDHTKVTGTLTNFPLLVKITNTDFPLHAQPNGADFAFTDPTNTTQYPHEIESYDPVNKTLIAWVRIPRLSSTQDVTLYLYYGNPTCPDQVHSKELWSEYIFVFHFANSIKSSTGNYTNANADNIPIFNAIGKIGSCINFPLSSNFFMYVPGFRTTEGAPYTLSTWISLEQTDLPLAAITQGNSTGGFALFVNNVNKIQTIAQTTAGPSYCYSSSPLQIGWNSIYNRVDPITWTQNLIINDIHEATSAVSGGIITEIKGLIIGSNITHNTFFSGNLDELRFCARALNDSWITTENTMIDSPETFLSSSAVSSQGSQMQPIYPFKLVETSSAQWANFTWDNPQITPGRTIGWRILFQDTSGNQNQTTISSFRIFGSTPPMPQGPNSALIGSIVTFTIQSNNIDDLYYQMDYGDGSPLNWIYLMPEVPQNITHIWEQSGVYEIRVRTQDNSGAISSWSPPATIAIIDKTPLTLTIPKTVVEGDEFNVTVTTDGHPIAGVVIRFMSILRTTNASGVASFTAPSASRTQTYPVTTSFPGYNVNNQTIIVTPTVPDASTGWIYGSVTNSTGADLRNVQVCANSSTDGINRCAFSDDAGRYAIPVPPGTYTIEASKIGYETGLLSEVVVNALDAVEVNVALSPTTIINRPSGNQDLIEAVIDAGVVAEKIAGRLDMGASGTFSVTSYDETFSASMVRFVKGTMSFMVSDTEAAGAIIATRLVDLGGVDDVSVLVDGRLVPQVSISELMAADNGSAAYARVIDVVDGQTVVYCLVYLPHFSSHTVEIRSVLQAAGSEALVLYLGVAVVMAFIVVLPIVVVERRRR